MGDPRWWNAQQPVIIRATELTLVSEPYVWDFTTKSKFDTETLEKATIIDNVRIYATAEVPAEVVMGEGVKFSKGAMVGANGEPEYSAVGVLTEGYGAIVVTAQGESGIETMQVLAGGDRYTILADGEPHKVVLGDLAGENNIYVLASSAVTLTKVEWTKDITPDQTVFPLAKPAINLSATSLDEGTAEAVTVSWEAVENADKYVLTGLGQTLEFAATDVLSLTVPAEQVAVLPVGEYPITLTAYPVETSSKYSASETATATFKIKEVVLGAPVTLTWDFSSAAWADVIAEIKNDKSCTTYNKTIDGLTLSTATKYLQAADNYIQMGGSGSTTERVFTFTAPANGTLKVTVAGAGKEDLKRNVVVQVGLEGEATKQVGGVWPDATELTWDITSNGETVYIYTDAGLRFYKIEYTYVAAAPKAEYKWNFSDEVWETQVFSWLAPLESAGSSDMNVTVDGLTIVAGGKNIRGYRNEEVGNYLQPNGGGSTTQRCFSFTAPGDGVVKVRVSGTGSVDMSRMVKLQVGDDASTLQEIAGGYASNEPTWIEFNISASNQTVYIYPSSGLRFYQIEYKEN